ncbi:hypothetical protein ACMDCR_07025 [Labrys okinawensis]|uniref:hypothetical protein n=1 Tax=Labrys okinawensis TaxID=346911 RepID=UPI0039BD5E5F
MRSKKAKWEEQRDAKTFVLASDATLQLAFFHLTASGGGALLADECVATPQALPVVDVASRKACVLTLLLVGQNRSRQTQPITDEMP